MNRPLDESIEEIKTKFSGLEENFNTFINFLTAPSKRGICR